MGIEMWASSGRRGHAGRVPEAAVDAKRPSSRRSSPWHAVRSNPTSDDGLPWLVVDRAQADSYPAYLAEVVSDAPWRPSYAVVDSSTGDDSYRVIRSTQRVTPVAPAGEPSRDPVGGHPIWEVVEPRRLPR
jgi:transcription antitermination factor NusG